MAEDMTSMDFEGNSDSGIGTGSDSQSVTSEGTLIGSPTPSIHGSDETSSTNLSLGETYHETSVIRTTSSGYHSGVVGSSSSGYHSGVVGSSSSGYQSGVVGSSSSGYQSGVVGPTAYSVTQPPKPASVGQNQDGSRGDTASQDSGISSMTSERSQSFPLQYTNDGKRTQEWINNSPFDVEVKFLDGKKTIFQVTEDETVTSFKEKIKQSHGIAANDQRLISGAGRSMADDKLLKDYEIRKTPKIYCQWGLRGG